MLVTDPGETIEFLLKSEFMHVLGAGMNTEKPANSAINELSERGWNPIPVHPHDAGASIAGYPIRPNIEDGVTTDIVVIFLSPERARETVKRLLIKNYGSSPVIWFQHGAEDGITEGWLDDAGWQYVKNDCIVRFLERHDLSREPKKIPWFKQVQRDDDSGCSVWSVHDYKENSDKSETELEWIGDLRDLEQSNLPIPRYIRSLANEGESLESCARRLAN